MLLLAIESSGLVASVAVMSDDTLLGEFTTNFKKTHSQTLLPMLDCLVSTLGLELSDIDAIAVAKGPGSFTGLRIGAATAKGLGLALDKPIIAVPTVDAIAYNLYGTDKLICPMMDARRSQVYTGIYTFKAGEFVTVLPQAAMGVSEIIEKINQLGRDVLFLGDGIPVYASYISEHAKVPYQFVPPHVSRQRSGALAALAKLYWEAGNIENADEHIPEYLRMSQAERERMERESSAEKDAGGR